MISVHEWIRATARRLGLSVAELGELRVKECLAALVHGKVDPENAVPDPDADELDRPLLLALERAAREVIVDDELPTTGSIVRLDDALDRLTDARRKRPKAKPVDLGEFALRFNQEKRISR